MIALGTLTEVDDVMTGLTGIYESKTIKKVIHVSGPSKIVWIWGQVIKAGFTNFKL